jgi:hypothetical protein
VENAGKPLEIIMRGLIDARLEVLLDVGETVGAGQTFTLRSLLMITKEKLKEIICKPLPPDVCLPFPERDILFTLNFIIMKVDLGVTKRTEQFPQSNKNNSTSSKRFYFILLLSNIL